MLFFNLVLSLLIAANPPSRSTRSPVPEKTIVSFEKNPVRIGILIPEADFREPVNAVSLAIDRANAAGGWKGHPLELVVRSTEGPWGAGSKESVALVYEDSVVAMLTSLDGRNAHLAEQVAAKSHLVCLSTYATDPTLTQAYVPWFLRVIPGDDQQSVAILEHIHGTPGTTKAAGVGILAVDQNDSRLAAGSFLRIAARKGLKAPEVFMFGDNQSDAGQLVQWIEKYGIQNLVVTAYDAGIVSMLAGIDPGITIYGTHMFVSALDPGEISGPFFKRMILVSAYVFSASSASGFRDEYRKRYGQPPGLTAYFAYDAALLLLEGIRLYGADRESLKEHLPGIRFREGITGSIAFDGLGNRKDAVRLRESP